MKKKIKVLIICIIIVIIAIAVYFTIKQINKKSQDYEIEQITDYKYYVSKNSESQKFGVIDTSGKIVVPEEYVDIEIS